MLAKVNAFGLELIDAVRCEVECDVSQRVLSKVTLVRLDESAVKESVERVRRAMINSGFAFPLHAVLINLAPADVTKEDRANRWGPAGWRWPTSCTVRHLARTTTALRNRAAIT